MRLDRLVAALLLAAAAAAQAGLVDPDPDAVESEAPPPPPLRTDGLIPLEIGRSSLRYGIDPASIAISSDGVVRYVVVARGTGSTVNGLYEGIRCSTGEVKVYAHWLPGSDWSIAKNPEWRSLQEARARHSLEIARTGACVGEAPNRTPSQIAADLRTPADLRFRLIH